MRRHAIILTLRSGFPHHAKAKSPNPGLASGTHKLSLNDKIVKSQWQSSQPFAGIYDTCLILGYCNGSHRRCSNSAKVSPVMAIVAACPVNLCQRRIPTST